MTNRKITISDKNYKKLEFNPETYRLSEELAAAVEVAIQLGLPLLITGEPGTGKTRLAWKIAHDLALGEPLVFNTKTTSAAQDLFYTYDALRHFHDAGVAKSGGEKSPDAKSYITLQALGKAIAQTNDKSEFVKNTPKSSVVLIDEIDKAPRDFPNDILNEIENYEFKIKELPERPLIKKQEGQRIITIMTSNSEKNLPDAFLRRVLFFHIPFPSTKELEAIAASHLGEDSAYTDTAFINHFKEIRDTVRRKPATAELLTWLKVLDMHNFLEKGELDFDNLNEEQKMILKTSYSVLAKTTEDLKSLRELV